MSTDFESCLRILNVYHRIPCNILSKVTENLSFCICHFEDLVKPHITKSKHKKELSAEQHSVKYFNMSRMFPQ